MSRDHFSRMVEMVGGGYAHRATTNHIEGVLGMVGSGTLAGQPYEEILRLKSAMPGERRREPVTSGRELKEGGNLLPPLPQAPDSSAKSLHFASQASGQGGQA